MPADPGNKTDENDLYAQHRAASQDSRQHVTDRLGAPSAL
jgi:hypothetical protein